LRPHVLFLATVLAATFGGTVLAAEPVGFPQGVPGGMEEIVFAVRSVISEHWYANFGYFSPDAGHKCYGKGGRLCKLSLKTGKMTVLLDDPQGAVRDPCVDYDGRRIVFSYRQGGQDAYHLYEIASDGGGLRQLTDGIYDDIEPCFLSDGGIVFVSARSRRWVNCWITQVADLYRCDADGRNLRQLSANLEQDNTPWVLPTGGSSTRAGNTWIARRSTITTSGP